MGRPGTPGPVPTRSRSERSTTDVREFFISSHEAGTLLAEVRGDAAVLLTGLDADCDTAVRAI
jgi:hypothetical protein